MYEDRFVRIPAGNLLVRKWLPPEVKDKRPVVLFHDSLGCVELWRNFPGILAARLFRPVIAYDRLGFGRSTPREGLPSPNFINEEAEEAFPALCETLNIRECSLYGYSVGGAMALLSAATGNVDCDWVTTVSAQAFVEPRTLAGIEYARERFNQPDQFSKLVKWHGERARWVLDAWTKIWLSAEFASWQLEDAHLAKVRCPVLAIHGDSDEYGSSAFPRHIVAGVAGYSKMRILKNCGHIPHNEQPDLLLQLVSDFNKRWSKLYSRPNDLYSDGT